ncbi:MAG: precorrin-3B synthase [Phyllobacteriaceae bacterium]|nr:precorrin-3B synthase [Phyllobacteriaceae bacterium]
MTGRDRPDPALVRGWCPGALRPMETGDGFLVRVRLPSGRLSAELAGELADLSRRYGNELIDLSQRANLQLRGVELENIAPLQERLAALGLVDRDEATEAVKNIVASPLSGLDPTAAIDGRALVEALETRLVEDTTLHALPAKFGFVVDEGGRLALDDVAVDVRLRGLPTADGPRVLIEIATAPAHWQPIAVEALDDVVDRAAALARAVITLRAGSADAPRRMWEIVKTAGLAAVFHAAGFGEKTAEIPTLPRARGAEAVLGDHTHAPGAFLGLGAPFGRFTADQLALLGDLAGERAIGEIRLTPWRAVLIPGVKPEKMPRIRPWIAAGRFVFSPEDPRLAVVCCSGSSGCRSASVPAREDGETLAPVARRLTRSGLTLHVSGCEKGCAHPGPALFTLTGRDGRYDLVRAGRPWDEPWMTGLTLEEAASALSDLAPL